MNFAKTPDYETLKKFLKNDMFFNIYVHGEKGCGKTASIIAIHEELGKGYIRVNVSIETDEDALIGRVWLRNGETVYEKGPVIQAMEEGKTLLLDEIDLGHPQRLMCLQSILEGSGYFIKKTNEMIYPKPGFRVIATANTKGSGDDTGNYIGTQMLNGAMIDRFSMFYHFSYASPEVETQILKMNRSVIDGGNSVTDTFLSNLVTWANQIRKNDDYIEHTVSTRKLIDIVKIFTIIPEEETAIRMGISAYPSEVIDAFANMYDLIRVDGGEAVVDDDEEMKLNMF